MLQLEQQQMLRIVQCNVQVAVRAATHRNMSRQGCLGEQGANLSSRQMKGSHRFKYKDRFLEIHEDSGLTCASNIKGFSTLYQ